ncbi:beta-class phenol-soluble modulin, partial [Staphylococcus capitis]
FTFTQLYGLYLKECTFMSGIVESLHNAVNSGLHVKQDWVDMGFGIANTIAKIVDQVLKFV